MNSPKKIEEDGQLKLFMLLRSSKQIVTQNSENVLIIISWESLEALLSALFELFSNAFSLSWDIILSFIFLYSINGEL